MKRRPLHPVLITAALLLSACAAPPPARPAAGGPPAAPDTPAPAPAAAGTPSAGRTVTLAVVGDINLGRGVGDIIARRGPNYPMAAVAARLGRADLAFASLESPLGVKGSPLPGKGSLLRARPETVTALRQAGIDGVTVASNHIFDYGAENFESMILEIRLGREGVAGYEAVPVMITDGQPRVLEGAAAARLRAKIEALSFPATAASR